MTLLENSVDNKTLYRIGKLFLDEYIDRSDNLETDAEGALMLIPVGAEHLETAYLGCAPHVLADAGTDVVVSNAYQADGFGNIIGQTAGIYRRRQLVARDKLESDGQILVDQLVHTPLNLLLFLTAGLMVEVKAHLTLLTLNMGVEGTLAAEETDHRLIQQMLCCMRWRKLFLIMFIQDIVCHALML